MSEETMHVDLDISAGRNIIGNGMSVKGNATVGGNLKVNGYIDAKDFSGPDKGAYDSADELRAAYPEPLAGWFAGVRTVVDETVSYVLYRSSGVSWNATEDDYNDLSLSAGSISTEKLADNAVTYAKLASTVQETLDGAAQKVTPTIGGVNLAVVVNDGYAESGIPVEDETQSGVRTKVIDAHHIKAGTVAESRLADGAVTTAKLAGNIPYTKLAGDIPAAKLASDVQTSLGKADNAIPKVNNSTNGHVAIFDGNGGIKDTNAQIPLVGGIQARRLVQFDANGRLVPEQAGAVDPQHTHGVYATKQDLNTGLEGKQDTLTFDSTPTSGSNNPVTSGGIYNALQNVATAIPNFEGVRVKYKFAAAGDYAVCNSCTGGYILIGSTLVELTDAYKYSASNAGEEVTLTFFFPEPRIIPDEVFSYISVDDGDNVTGAYIIGIHIPSYVHKIGASAFKQGGNADYAGYNNDLSIDCEAMTPPLIDGTADSFSNVKIIDLIVHSLVRSEYSGGINWANAATVNFYDGTNGI